MASFNWPVSGGGGGITVYANLAAFPSVGSNGDVGIAGDTNIVYEYQTNDNAWHPIASAAAYASAIGAATSLGPFGSTPNADGASLSGNVLTLQPADGTHPGGLSILSQTIAGQKTFSTGLTGTLTGSASLNVLTSALGNLTDAGTDGITVTGGTGAVVGSVSLAQHVADTTHNGYLSSTDWNTFNGKQGAGNYITALTGDVTATGPGSVAATLATVNSNIGTFAAVTVNGKGLVTAAANLSGDITTSGAVSTLATVNSNVGSFSPAAVTVNGKGLVTAASNVTTGNLTDAGTDGITVTGGTGAVLGSGTSLSQHVADTTHNGYLSSTDWNTFNGKQASGNYITSLTGPITASGPGAAAVSITAQTGTGTTFVMQASPTLTTPNIGAATGTSLNLSGLTASQAVVTDGSKNLASLAYATAATATTLAERDANANLSNNNELLGYATTATAAGTTTLTVSSAYQQYFTGTSTQTVVLPVTSTLVTGQSFAIVNNSTGNVTVQSSGNNNLQVMAASTQLIATCISTSGTGTSSWSWIYLPLSQSTLAVQPTIQKFTSGSGTYTTPAGVQWIRVRMCGGGGGGSGSGTSPSAAGDGGATTFGSSLLTANGGTKGSQGGGRAGGGSVTINSPAIGTGIPGGEGQGGGTSASSTNYLMGGMGGANAFGGAGAGGPPVTSGGGGIANTGAGGGGGGTNGTSTSSGWGGGSGGYIDAIITSPSATYAYAVGTSGTAGGAGGSGGAAGGAGAAGYIEVTEYYYNLGVTSQITAVSPTVQKFTSSSGTYTTPAGVQYIRVRMVGGGGGGAGSGNSPSAAGDGGSTTFGSSLLTCTGGAKGVNGTNNGGAGGTPTLNSPAIGTSMSGAAGGGKVYNTQYSLGGYGGSSYYGGAGAPSNGAAGGAAATNSGSGGAGGSIANTSSIDTGSAGGAGAFIDAIITSPSATYSYAVGAAGTAGGAGSGGGFAGGAGAAGYIEVTEFYTNLAVGTAAAITANYVMAGPSSGAATQPNFRALVSADLPAAICARFYNSAVNHSIGTSLTTLIGDTTSYSNGITVSAATGLFTILTAGKYKITGFCSTNTAGTSGDVVSWGLVKNGSAVTGYGGVLNQILTTGAQYGWVVTDTINLAVNDTIGVQFKESGHAFTANQQESVAIEWVGA